MPEKTQSVTLNNGVIMPILGLGVFLSKPEETAQAVETALTDGYRLIDTAAAYNNERQVGEGIRRSSLDRSQIFVTSKLWMTDYGRDKTRKGCEASLRRLGLDSIDLYLLHWPMPADFKATLEAYKELEKLAADGLIRAIGVSNFSAQHLDRLLGETSVVPAVNQIELHPYFVQRELREYHARHKIATEAWSPIGGVYYRHAKADSASAFSPLQNPIVEKLAGKYNKTPAQVVLRWHVEHGVVAIPKSTKPERIAENINIFDFTLNQDEVAAIDSLDTGKRSGRDPEAVKADTFSTKIER